MKENKQQLYDINILFILFLFGVLSCLYIYHAQQLPQYETNFAVRQLTFFIIAFLIMLALLHFDFEYYLQMSWMLYGFGLLLLLTLAIAPESIAPPNNGAVRWFKLPVIGSFQPSELMKIFIILLLSSIIYKHNHTFHTRTFATDIRLILKMTAATAPPVLLFVLQPDMGMVMMTAAIFFSLLLVSGISYKIVSVLFGLPLTAFASFLTAFWRFPEIVEQLLFSRLSDYQVRRFYGWLKPLDYLDEGYQTAKSLLLIGSGSLLGSEVKGYLPEAHTDFIFAIIGNTHGFAGASFLISLYFIFLYLIMLIALRCHHSFGTLLCAGVIGMFSFQIFQNIGMTIGLLPVTGFTLPFISYGGSSLFASMAAVGIILSVKYHSRNFMFASKAL
ncbi:FtsW/RodA/SpoVE family cell cycle protein [Bacillus piscicola]|uniref:FtsW/RodA/SpoVE family cell cycle protein n=1 Tax=Bacillus piscicola TaxID=1632684 RepID=UPI001F08EBD3|nr:FtsW/RodA/SpoVE family cell cycle protein [Bacillus piscicola]